MHKSKSKRVETAVCPGGQQQPRAGHLALQVDSSTNRSSGGVHTANIGGSKEIPSGDRAIDTAAMSERKGVAAAGLEEEQKEPFFKITKAEKAVKRQKFQGGGMKKCVPKQGVKALIDYKDGTDMRQNDEKSIDPREASLGDNTRAAAPRKAMAATPRTNDWSKGGENRLVIAREASQPKKRRQKSVPTVTTYRLKVKNI